MSHPPQLKAIGRPRLLHGLTHARRVDAPTHRRFHNIPARMSARDLLRLAESVDLRGRGGAAFPFARKLKAVVDASSRTGRDIAVLVNATEGEPAAFKDKALLTHVPHLILDGALLAARSLGAAQLVIAVTDPGMPGMSLQSAIAEAGLEDTVRLVELPERFITGEGGALVRGVNGETPIPPAKKVRAAESGVDGLPTLLSNAETFAQLALLAELGPDGYRQAGLADEPGTHLLSVSATDGRRLAVEAPAGVPLEAVFATCGTTAGQGVLIGGYHGSWLTPEAAATVRLNRASLREYGAALGAGIVVPLPEDTCPLGEVSRVATYMGAESAGQCGPCRLGLPAIAGSVAALAAGTADPDVITEIRRGSSMIRGRGACSHPDGTTRFLLSALEVFAKDVERHLHAGTCGRKVRKVLPLGEQQEEAAGSGLKLSINWSRCAAHGLCGHLVPRLVELDRFGYPMIADGGVPPELVPDAMRAAELCPALALSLTPAAAH